MPLATNSVLATLVALIITVLGFLILVLWCMFSDERRRRLKAERRNAELRAKITELRSTTRSSWTIAAPKRPRQVHLPATPTPTDTKEQTVLPNRPTSRRRFVPAAAVALGVLLTLGAAGCYPQPATLHPFTPGASSDQVVLFGDSLAAMAQQPAEALLAADPNAPTVSYNATGGTRLQHWFEAMANVPDGASVVVELGTNNVTLDLIADTTAYLHQALDLLADQPCVVIPTLNTDGGHRRGWPYDVRTDAFNAELARLLDAGTYPNLRVWDWNATAYGHPEWLQGTAVSPADWVHYNGVHSPGPSDPTGNDRYAQAIHDMTEVCA